MIASFTVPIRTTVMRPMCARPVVRASQCRRTCSTRDVRRSRQCPPTAAAPDIQPVPPFRITEANSETRLKKERQWLAAIITSWLDEEWTPLEVHAQLGQAAGEAYVKARATSETDISDILMTVVDDLKEFNYRETFTGPFEVSNKVVEIVMMSEGCDVCSTAPQDAERLIRFKHMLE